MAEETEGFAGFPAEQAVHPSAGVCLGEKKKTQQDWKQNKSASEPLQAVVVC